MNERIRELAEQAGFNDMGIWNIIGIQEYHEKFAELIVRECIKESLEEIVADEEIAQEKDPLVREYLKGNNQGIVDAVVRFRNHFEIEP